MLAELIPCLQDPEARALAGLDGTLLEAHHLVMSCQSQRRGLTSQLLSASSQAKRFRDVDRKIDTYLSIIPVISYIGIARRLDGNPSSRSQSLLVRSSRFIYPSSSSQLSLSVLAVYGLHFIVISCLGSLGGVGTS